MGNQFLKGLQRPAIMPEGSSLPDYSEAQDGDALIIDNGEPVWGAVEALPEIEETDEGKVLSVDQGEAVWGDAPSGLPEITNADEGKVLTVVDNSGTIEAEWAEPSGVGSKVTVTHQPTSGGSPVNTFVWSHTISQIANMLNNGITPILEYNMLDDNGDPAPITPIYIPYTGCITTFDTVNSISFVSDVFLEVDPDTDGWIIKKTAILYTAEGTDLQEEQFVLMPD